MQDEYNDRFECELCSAGNPWIYFCWGCGAILCDACSGDGQGLHNECLRDSGRDGSFEKVFKRSDLGLLRERLSSGMGNWKHWRERACEVSQDAPPTSPSSQGDSPEIQELREKLRPVLHSGGQIGAIRLTRELTGWSLMDAKNFVCDGLIPSAPIKKMGPATENSSINTPLSTNATPRSGNMAVVAPPLNLPTMPDATPTSPFIAAFSDASDEIRYLIMRTARLLMSLVIEITMFAMAVPMVFSVYFSIFYILTMGNIGTATNGNPFYLFVANHCLISAAILVPTVLFLWVQCMAVGIPYRFSTTPPGLRLKKCWRCAGEIPDYLNCPLCGAWRNGRVITIGVWMLSFVVTVAFVINDTLMVLITVAGMSKGNK